jgi:hypothetical protein
MDVKIDFNVINIISIGTYNAGFLTTAESHATENNAAADSYNHNHESINVDNDHINSHNHAREQINTSTSDNHQSEHVLGSSQPHAPEEFRPNHHHHELPEDQPSCYRPYTPEGSPAPSPTVNHHIDEQTQNPADTLSPASPGHQERFHSCDEGAEPAQNTPAARRDAMRLSDKDPESRFPVDNSIKKAPSSDSDPDLDAKFWNTTAQCGSFPQASEPEEPEEREEPQFQNPTATATINNHDPIAAPSSSSTEGPNDPSPSPSDSDSDALDKILRLRLRL